MRGGKFDKNQKSKKRECVWPVVQLAIKAGNKKRRNEAWEGRNDAAKATKRKGFGY